MLPIMQRRGQNTLVLQQNDLLDVCTQLDLTVNYGVLDLLGAHGQADPASPTWAAFCRRKTVDLLDRVPDIGGFIVNLLSPDSRESLPDHLATQTNALNKSDWFDKMIAAFAEPLSANGKALYIRDFSYTADMQSEVLSAVNRSPFPIGASVKITAHDYFPEYPENPAIRTVQGTTILEFEAFGEHTGWGIIPNCRVTELCERMKTYRDVNARSTLIRTSWEAITGAYALDSLSAVNA